MKACWIALFVVILAIAGGCERRADVSRLKTFHEGSLEFDYPKNWRVSKNELQGNARLIFIEAPGSALVILTVYAPQQEVSLRRYAEAIRSGLGEAVPFGVIERNSVSGSGGALDVTFSLKLLGEEVPHTANITLHGFSEGTVICMSQVADEDRQLVAPGFDIVRKSLRSASPNKPNQSSQPSRAFGPRG